MLLICVESMYLYIIAKAKGLAALCRMAALTARTRLTLARQSWLSDTPFIVSEGRQ